MPARTAGIAAALLVAAVAQPAALPAPPVKSSYPAAPAELTGKPAPALKARYLDRDAPYVLEPATRGAVLLVFFATWCDACRRLEPALASLVRRFAPAGLTVVALSHEPRRRLREAQSRRRPPYLLLQCTGRTVLRYGATNVPAVVLVDHRGIVRGGWQGSDRATVQEIEAALRNLARVPGSRRLKQGPRSAR